MSCTYVPVCTDFNKMSPAIWSQGFSASEEHFFTVLTDVRREEFNKVDSREGTTMLMYVIRQGWNDAAMAVLNHEFFDPTTINTRQRRPATWPYESDPICRTALHIATLQCKLFGIGRVNRSLELEQVADKWRPVIEKLLEIPNILNLPDDEGSTPLMVMVELEEYDIAHKMLRVFSGDNINSTTGGKVETNTVLGMLIGQGSVLSLGGQHPDVLRKSADTLRMCGALLDHGADPNIKIRFGSIFFMAISRDLYKYARLMLKYTTAETLDLFHQFTYDNNTPLSWVCRHLKYDVNNETHKEDVKNMCKELLEAGADPNLAGSLNLAIAAAFIDGQGSTREHALDVVKAHLSTKRCSDTTKASAFSTLIGLIAPNQQYSRNTTLREAVQKVANLLLEYNTVHLRGLIRQTKWTYTLKQALEIFDDLVHNYYKPPTGPGYIKAKESAESQGLGVGGGGWGGKHRDEGPRSKKLKRISMPSLVNLRIR